MEDNLEAMPGLSVTQSGKFMKKKDVCGKMYLNLITCHVQEYSRVLRRSVAY